MPGALESSYVAAFERLGYEPFCFDAEKFYRTGASFAHYRFLRRAFRGLLWDRMNRTALEIAACIRPCMVFAVKCCFLAPATVRSMRNKLGIPVTNFYPDHPYCGVPLNPRNGASTQRRNLIETFREYSTVWIWEKQLARRLRRDGVEAHYLPFAVDRDQFNPENLKARIGDWSGCGECRSGHQVVFVGHYNARRGQHVSRIRKHEVALWGNGWTRMSSRRWSHHRLHHAPVAGRQMASLYRWAAVSLNIVGDLNIPGHNMRTFEIPASGGVMLSRYTEEQAEFLPEDEAAAYYRTPEELDAKIARLIGDRELNVRLRGNGMRLMFDHCYERRASAILKHLTLPGSSC